MSKREIDSLQRICLFVCTIYANFWFTAPLATAAPVNNLLMLQMIEGYRKVDSKIAKVVKGKMRLHLWYLSEVTLLHYHYSVMIAVMEKKRLLSVQCRKIHCQKMCVVSLLE